MEGAFIFRVFILVSISVEQGAIGFGPGVSEFDMPAWSKGGTATRDYRVLS